MIITTRARRLSCQGARRERGGWHPVPTARVAAGGRRLAPLLIVPPLFPLSLSPSPSLCLSLSLSLRLPPSLSLSINPSIV